MIKLKALDGVDSRRRRGLIQAKAREAFIRVERSREYACQKDRK